jgi:hypothetical protein
VSSLSTAEIAAISFPQESNGWNSSGCVTLQIRTIGSLQENRKKWILMNLLLLNAKVFYQNMTYKS